MDNKQMELLNKLLTHEIDESEKIMSNRNWHNMKFTQYYNKNKISMVFFLKN